MMAAAGPPSTSSFLPLLETLEDGAAGQSEQTDAYLTIANRLSGEEGRQFLPAVEKHFSRLGRAILAHVSSPNAELSQAALQALGFCVYHSHIVSGLSDVFAAEILLALCSLVTNSTDKNTCTRALWVVSKQSFSPDVVAKNVPTVLSSLESVWTRQDVQSVVMEHEALNVVIRMLEQVPAQMGDGAVRWAKLVVPLVVHSASKVRLRAAAAMEMGMPLLLAKQAQVAAVIEPMMSPKLIPELQKLFMSKNETNVLKLWPLFIKLLGKLLHKGGPFINSLLHLEELGFRSSSPTIKKIAFIAWKSLIDNFALNPDILCSAKRMKLLMQPLVSISVRTEALLLTKVEVWWYLVVQLGSNLSSNFDQVSVPLLQTTMGSDSSSVPGTPSRTITQNGSIAPSTPKSAGSSSFNTSSNTPRVSLNSSMHAPSTFPSIQLLGLEMLLHYLLGPEVVAMAAKNELVLSLEPLKQPLLSGSSSFTKHAAVLISSIRDGFVHVGRDAPEPLQTAIWTNLVRFVSLTVESGGKKDRQGCEVLTLMLQALQSIVSSEVLPADRVLLLFEATVKGIPQRVLGSASYQVGKMDVLNGTPALFLILLLFNSSMLPAYLQDERFFHCLHTLVGCGLSGPASPLAFAEAVLGAVGRSAGSLQDKEQLWRMWSLIVGPLTDTITQSNEVNQGDSLEHNFSAVHSALMFPVTHLLRGSSLPQASQKAMLSSWSKLYKVFARCSALVVTAEENVCCEELCAKMVAAVDREVLAVPATLNAVSGFLHVMVDCVDFSPYTPHSQQKLKSPHTPVNWARKRNKALGNLVTFQSLLVDCFQVYLEAPDAHSEATGSALLSILMALFSNLVLNSAVQEVLTVLVRPLTLLYKHAASETSRFSSSLQEKLEKLLGDVLSCLQTRSTLAFNDELLALMEPLLCVLFPHRNKHLRSAVTQFWNATFGNAVSLTYPEEIRLVLSQVKQKIPIILPGFQAVGVPGELSEQYSSESSELETKLSGMPISSAGKRESLLGKTAELSSMKTSKPVSTKLDFSSPKPPRREILEEEASIDFVFIPPETKERVLTEHQKEVKRTKRVDIPAMYNNLDASLDTSVFIQFTQSQDDTSDKTPTEPTSDDPKQALDEVTQRDEGKDEDTQEYASPKDVETANVPEEETHPDVAAVSMDTKTDGGAEDGTSPNVSTSSDLVSGTPQKPSSRRQSFITLETYTEGKPASPSSSSSFTGPLLKPSNAKKTSPSGLNSQDSPQIKKTSPEHPVSGTPESPRRPKDSTKSEPVRLIEKLPTESMEEEDVIPDTQAGAEEKPNTAPLGEKPTARGEESEPAMEASQSSPDEPRRSGRQRVRPLLPGEDPEDRQEKYRQLKQRRSGEDPKNESAKTPQSRPNTRSLLAAEESAGRDRLRSRSRNSSESSQTSSQGRPRKKMKLFSSLEDFLDKPERKRRSTSDRENSQTDFKSDTQSDSESQSPRRRGRPRKSALEMEEKHTSRQEGGASKTVTPSPQTGSKSQETEAEEKKEEDKKPKDEQDVQASSQTEDMPQQNSPQLDMSALAESKDGSTNKVQSETIKDKDVAMEADDENISREDSQTTPASDSQTTRRSRRSKTPSEATESEHNTEAVGLRRRSQSSTPVLGQTEAGSGGRTRRSKVQEELSRSSPSTTPNASQSLDVSGSESPKGRGRYSRRGSSLASAAAVESSESESSEVQGISIIPKRRGRKPRLSLQSPHGSQTNDASQKAESQSLEESSETRDLGESQEVSGNVEEERNAVVSLERHQGDESPSNTEQRHTKTNVEKPEAGQDWCPSAGDSTAPLNETTETPEVSKPSEDKDENVVTEKRTLESDSDHQEVPEEDTAEEDGMKLPQDSGEQLPDFRAEEDTAALQEDEEDNKTMEDDAKQTEAAPGSSEPPIQVSPVKLMDQVASTGLEVGQSPSDGRTKGTWSPSASPSSSILKKAQKRQLEVETTSPLVKSRRVSFASPIQRQEIADDIDRRSLSVKTSSPKQPKTSSIPQPKLNTTPTKSILKSLSPRNLHSSGYKSSKKCLIAETSQEPRAIPKYCIYPSLVGCSAPVEAVLPQIASSMWSRGFGQLIRARNIKTVGDLSALTPTEVRTLPICPPKMTNVQNALAIYEQQRKGRGGDELKSFDETEMMTSEQEETGAPQAPEEEEEEEEEKTSGETLATELVDEPGPTDLKPERTTSTTQIPDGEQRPDGLSSAVEALTCRATPLELSRCSPQQLIDIHYQLGDLMRSVALELQARFCSQDPKIQAPGL
ncbi:telomere-associated protein RIF1 isoform X2 [Melanotaenia boesemani]|uniref:telomere-associated protein RIF1 isoform X2 n=1 Tax=Melanotaenia boesemani TaxID=1250792 RepID=UPI001C03CC5A|nr:telomere-associated protein RIF1 isoform X2 [Melanotaenia boesemani]